MAWGGEEARRWPLRVIARDCGEWISALLAAQGVASLLHRELFSAGDFAILAVGGCLLAAFTARFHPRHNGTRARS